MLVHNHPFTIELFVTSGGAPVHVDFLSANFVPSDSIEAVAESDLVADGDVQVANIATDFALEGGKPVLGAPSASFRAEILQRIDDIEGNNANGGVAGGAIDVPGSDAFQTIDNEGANLSFVSASVILQRHQSLPIRRSTTRITKTSPSPPLGPYPQLRLCGQCGSAPSNMRMRITRRIVPNIGASIEG